VATRRARRKAPRRVPAVADSAAGLRYIESSALLSALLEQDAAARKALQATGRRVTSALTFAEAARALVRARVAGRLSSAEERAALRWLQTFRRRCDVFSVTQTVLARVGRPFPIEPIRTLDAIHVATAEALGEPPQLVSVVTRDVRVSDNARALGYAIE
jgi:predicted nucleic acid-binding protein